MAMEAIEFYSYNNEVWYMNGGESMKYTESSIDITAYIIEQMINFYPEAYKALEREFCNIRDVRLRKFRTALRFIKCNFGCIDDVLDIGRNGALNLERVACPLRGECSMEGVVCSPKFHSNVSDGEKRVLRLVCKGKTNEQIANELYISPFTVKNHISNAYRRLGLNNRAEFVRYAQTNNLFKDNEE